MSGDEIRRRSHCPGFGRIQLGLRIESQDVVLVRERRGPDHGVELVSGLAGVVFDELADPGDPKPGPGLVVALCSYVVRVRSCRVHYCGAAEFAHCLVDRASLEHDAEGRAQVADMGPFRAGQFAGLEFANSSCLSIRVVFPPPYATSPVWSAYNSEACGDLRMR